MPYTLKLGNLIATQNDLDAPLQEGQIDAFVTCKMTFRLVLVQAGCCNPPLVCGYTFVNPTLWINPTNPNADTDCGTWSQDQTQLCYDCNSCKAGVVADVKQQWRKVAVVSVVVLVALAIVYIIGCCAFRNAQTEDLFKRYEEGYTSRSWRRRNWFRNE